MFSYSPISTTATYSPWSDDVDFTSAYNTIARNTLVDMYRCYELWSLVKQIAHLDSNIIEVGVWRGGTGGLLAKRAQMLGMVSRVFLCDTFRGVAKAGPMDPHYRGGEHADTSIGIVQELMSRLEVTNTSILEGVFPDETGERISDRRFGLCHIDVDVYESSRAVLDWIWPRLIVGGVVVYDDYGFSSCAGVTRLVNERQDRADAVSIYNLNGHAVVVKTYESQRG